MSRFKAGFAVLILAAIVEVVPAHAVPAVRVMIAGSSAMWQSQALGAYNGGKCVTGTAPCKHYTGANFNLTDTRPTALGGSSVTDKDNIWIVSDHAVPSHV